MERQEKPEENSYEERDFGWLVIMSLMFFALVALAFWYEYDTEWSGYQAKFPGMLAHYGKAEQAAKFRAGVKQIWIPEISVVDRCVTCHLGYDWTAVLPASTAQPLTPHDNPALIAKHPFEKFGCTPCHGGQGWATTAAAAHTGGAGWDEPMLSTSLAKQYGLTMDEMMQMRCNYCHRHDEATPGMDEINLAKKLFKKRKCIVCHVVEGHGGNTGPELTYEGDINPELYNFANVTGERTFLNWNIQHLQHASHITPTTQMPDFDMPEPDARALSLMLLSWKRLRYPPQYIPAPEAAAAAMATPTATPTATATPSPAPTPAARAKHKR